jgi:hypothetical protein
VENWKIEKLKDWKVGKLKRWKVERLESWEVALPSFRDTHFTRRILKL